MGVGHNGKPNVYGAGLDFDYSVWTPGTRIDLVNVNWDNTYRDVVRFASKAALNSFIDGKASSGITVEQMTYAKPGEDIYLNIPYNRVNRFNYLRASNPLMPIPDDLQKDYYYFILDSEYVSPNTTRLRLQLDIWQTYVYDVVFGRCYLERGHMAVANSNKFNNYGRDYLTVPEGLDIGAEYQVIARRNEVLIRNSLVSSAERINGDILVVTTVDVDESGGTVDNPILKTATGSNIQGIPSGADFYVFKTVADFQTFMSTLADKPWISQGIVSVTMVPSIERYGAEGYESGDKIHQLITFPIEHELFSNWRANAMFSDYIGARYQHVKEKFFTFPYMMIEMTTWTGNPAVLKPESWNNANAKMLERASFMPPNQRVEFIPRGYNAISGAAVDNLHDIPDSSSGSLATIWHHISDKGDDSGDYLDMAVIVSNFPSMPVVNNMAIGYLAANAHGIAYQWQSADWSQTRALQAAQSGYDIATGALHTMQDLAGSGVNADIAQTANANRTLAAQAAVNAISQGVSGVGNALTPAGFAGSAITGLSQATATGINAGIQTASNDEALAIRNTMAGEQIVARDRQGRLERDTNYDLATFAARGDYANTIAGINAKVHDAMLTQPSVSGQFGGESHQIATNKLEVSLRWKMLDKAAIRVIGEYWLRYGYAARAFITPPADLKAMSKFTYWKMSETYISGATVPEKHKQGLRGIMEKGVTVWTDPNDIGVIDIANNVPLGGISY